MIAYDIFDEFKRERKKIGFKRTFTRKSKLKLGILATLGIVVFILLMYLGIQLNQGYFVLAAIIIGASIFGTFGFLFNEWDITDYDDCNNKLLSATNLIVLNAFNRLKEKSNIYVRDTGTFIDYIMDYVNNLDEDTRKKKELAFKIFILIIFPIALGVAYSLFNNLDTKTLKYTLITILIISVIGLFFIVEIYEIIFLSSRKKHIRKDFLQILQILKSSVNLDNKPKDNNMNKNKEVLLNYLETNKEITIKQVQELFEMSYSKSKILLEELTEEGKLTKHISKNKYLYTFLNKDK